MKSNITIKEKQKGKCGVLPQLKQTKQWTVFCPSVLIFDPFSLRKIKENNTNIDKKKYWPGAMIRQQQEAFRRANTTEKTKIFPMQSSHTMSCVIANETVQVTWGAGVWTAGGDVPNRGRLGCILCRLELLALIRLIPDLRVFRVTQSRARLWGNLITKLTNRWKKMKRERKGKASQTTPCQSGGSQRQV